MYLIQTFILPMKKQKMCYSGDLGHLTLETLIECGSCQSRVNFDTEPLAEWKTSKYTKLYANVQLCIIKIKLAGKSVISMSAIQSS